MISIYIDLNLRSRYHVVTKHSPNASTKEVICFPCNPVKSSSELPKSFRWVRSSNNWIVTDLVHLMNLSLLDSWMMFFGCCFPKRSRKRSKCLVKGHPFFLMLLDVLFQKTTTCCWFYLYRIILPKAALIWIGAVFFAQGFKTSSRWWSNRGGFLSDRDWVCHAGCHRPCYTTVRRWKNHVELSFVANCTSRMVVENATIYNLYQNIIIYALVIRFELRFLSNISFSKIYFLQSSCTVIWTWLCPPTRPLLSSISNLSKRQTTLPYQMVKLRRWYIHIIYIYAYIIFYIVYI